MCKYMFKIRMVVQVMFFFNVQFPAVTLYKQETRFSKLPEECNRNQKPYHLYGL